MATDQRKQLLVALQAALPTVRVVAPDECPALLTDWRRRYHGDAIAVAFPRTTAEVAAVVSWCRAHQVTITPQGGNTGLCGGATPLGGERPRLLLNLQRLDRIRSVDPLGGFLVAEAGVTVAALQAAAAEANRLFALSLASEGSATLGGVLSTNAGGVHVVRYGTMRAQVLGVEAVLADGSVVANLSGLRKDNTGYDWRDLLVGAEGTLGIITAAAVRLFSRPRWQQTVWVALADLDAAAALFVALQETFGDKLTAFELMGRMVFELVLRHIPEARAPWQGAELPEWAALVELSDTAPAAGLEALTESFWGETFEKGWVWDVAVALSEAQRLRFWQLRESASEAQQREGVSIKHDIALPLAQIVPFIRAGEAHLPARFPGVRIACFGHFGDGNLHYNCFLPSGLHRADRAAAEVEVTRWIHDEVVRRGGSFSAEHGIGLLKVEAMARYKSDAELALMRRIKAALDPDGLFNPGKVLPEVG
uniref:FAD dependent oxidoreductase n=1 Tax=uncultured beta proteobacterium TaxID=86027 RepID=H5SGX2_9PROT|nr:FAD dependent oxidoreductase [uncultured beta proteobacterium]